MIPMIYFVLLLKIWSLKAINKAVKCHYFRYFFLVATIFCVEVTYRPLHLVGTLVFFSFSLLRYRPSGRLRPFQGYVGGEGECSGSLTVGVAYQSHSVENLALLVSVFMTRSPPAIRSWRRAKIEYLLHELHYSAPFIFACPHVQVHWKLDEKKMKTYVISN